MDNEKAKPPKGRVGGGRAIGQKNKVKNPAVKQSISEIFKNMLGIDDQAVERTGMIDGKGVGFRRRWQEILDGERSADPAYTAAVRLSLSYALGNPGKMQVEGERRQSLSFVTTHGLAPWDPRVDSMREITDRMIQQGKDEEQLKKLEAAKPVVIIDATDKGDTDLESLEVVQPPPAPDDSAFR